MKKVRIVLIVVTAAAAALVLPVLLRGDRLAMDQAARAAAPGSFVSLSEGVVHYELAGPAGGQPVAFINGVSVPFFLWDGTYEAMAAAGYRVLRYDFYGRGYSDRPGITYDRALYIRQLAELLDAVGITTPVDVVGLSLGGGIAAAFTAAHPDRVRHLVMMSPAPSAPKPPFATVLGVPGLGDWFFAAFGGAFLASTQASDFHDLKNIPPLYMERYREQLRYRGFSTAILSTLRNVYSPGFMDVYAKAGGQGKPVMLLWGTEDTTNPFANAANILALIPNAEFHPISEAGHLVHLEKREEVLALMKGFLGR